MPSGAAYARTMTTEHPSITTFRDEHARRGGTGEVVILPDSVHTAALAAEALGCEVGAIANSLLFDADGSPALILTSGAHRVDTAKVAATIGVRELRRAEARVRPRAHRSGDRRRLPHRPPEPGADVARLVAASATTSCGPRRATRPRCSPRRTPSWSR